MQVLSRHTGIARLGTRYHNSERQIGLLKQLLLRGLLAGAGAQAISSFHFVAPCAHSFSGGSLSIWASVSALSMPLFFICRRLPLLSMEHEVL